MADEDLLTDDVIPVGTRTNLQEARVRIWLPIKDDLGNLLRVAERTFDGPVIAADPSVPGSVKQDLLAATRTFAKFFLYVS